MATLVDTRPEQQAAPSPPPPAAAAAGDLDDRILALQREIETLERADQARQDIVKRLNGAATPPPAAAADDPPAVPSAEDPFRARAEVDARSIYVGQVDYSTTPAELATHMQTVGMVNRVTIMMDKWTGWPKGFGYVEYASRDAAVKAVEAFNLTPFRGRVLRVALKRTNVPWYIARQYGGYDKVPWVAPPARVAGATGEMVRQQRAEARRTRAQPVAPRAPNPLAAPAQVRRRRAAISVA